MRVRLELEGDTFEVDLERTPTGFRVTCDDETSDVDVVERGPPVRLRRQAKVHVVDVLADDAAALDGVPFRFHLARFEPGAAAGAATGSVAVRALMPGRIVRVLAQPGAAVAKGEPLLVLEAMKMQNELASPVAGRVAEVVVAQGDTVEAGRLLARIEPA